MDLGREGRVMKRHPALLHALLRTCTACTTCPSHHTARAHISTKPHETPCCKASRSTDKRPPSKKRQHSAQPTRAHLE